MQIIFKKNLQHLLKILLLITDVIQTSDVFLIINKKNNQSCFPWRKQVWPKQQK